MSLSSTTIDRIVANVLNQISPSAQNADVAVDQKQESPIAEQTRLRESVITADALAKFKNGQSLHLLPKAIITPAANDLIRERNLQIQRTESAASKPDSDTETKVQSSKLSVAIVRHTPSMQQAIEELGEINKELLSCSDDAAKFAISEICRTGATTVLLFAEQTHRAACLSNRNNKAKAVAIKDVGDVKNIRKQLRANIWCIDPTDRSYFELKNLLKVIRS